MIKYDIVYACNAKCFHTIDWYRAVKSVAPHLRIALATDLIDSEGHPVLVGTHDVVISLVNIDGLLLPYQSRLGDILRNIVKLLFLPVQALRLRSELRKNPAAVVHAVTMYYMMVCWLAKVDFIGTPQGSEILVRSKTKIYGFFARRAISAAQVITVDSVSMADFIKRSTGVDAVIVQNGIDVSKFLPGAKNVVRDKVVSMRGLAPLYRIAEILISRNYSSPATALEIAYPFVDTGYEKICRSLSQPGDQYLGRLPNGDLCELFSKSLLAIAIPESDASPRSVYEAIFSGAVVACPRLDWIRMLPDSMRDRLFIAELSNPDWFADALEFANERSKRTFSPCEEAIRRFDQYTCMRDMVRSVYKLNLS